jgi:hypothetical protein
MFIAGLPAVAATVEWVAAVQRLVVAAAVAAVQRLAVVASVALRALAEPLAR